MKRALSRVDVSDLLAVVGFALVEYGVSRWSTSAAWVIGGLVLIAVAIAPLRKEGRR